MKVAPDTDKGLYNEKNNSIDVFFFFLARYICTGLPGSIVGKTLPYTWELPFMGGKIVSTLTEDGTIYSQSITPCYSCNGTGRCGACGGIGAIYYGFGESVPCGACSMNGGRCRGCGGKGFSIMNYQTTSFGGTIGYDEHGNCYVSSTSRGGSRGSGRKSSVYNCCSGVPTFGYDRKHTCRNCGEYHYIGNHKCIRE